jgi:hypothetical protein
MTTKRVLGAAVAGAMIAAAGVAVAASYGSSRQTDFFAPGTHQFYVWCAGGTDFLASEQGTSAQDAQMKLYNIEKAAGKSTCWPLWQRRVSG